MLAHQEWSRFVEPLHLLAWSPPCCPEPLRRAAAPARLVTAMLSASRAFLRFHSLHRASFTRLYKASGRQLTAYQPLGGSMMPGAASRWPREAVHASRS